MKIVRFESQQKIYTGELKEGKIHTLTGEWSSLKPEGKIFDLQKVRLLVPCRPTKIIAVGKNYPEHIKEVSGEIPKEPILFMKPPTAALPTEGAIIFPEMSHRVDYEAELGVVMKAKAKGIPAQETENYILGYTCVNDVTARDLQKKDGQWTRAKSFDTFAPIGPWIVTGLDPFDLKIESALNGELKQTGRTSQMLFNIRELISFISQVMTLEPGDVVATGTPSGIGPMKRGDTIEVTIEGIGTLRNRVV
ncbi:MAG TPA: fumarylacetoacetate hydrolase family protein [Nitrospiria bacterium]|jgi:2-keto-4-pentenoate hydratase/2-oxohepta-3-ene-1,7-dioic acid hydratase in catechol pathway